MWPLAEWARNRIESHHRALLLLAVAVGFPLGFRMIRSSSGGWRRPPGQAKWQLNPLAPAASCSRRRRLWAAFASLGPLLMLAAVAWGPSDVGAPATVRVVAGAGETLEAREGDFAATTMRHGAGCVAETAGAAEATPPVGSAAESRASLYSGCRLAANKVAAGPRSDAKRSGSGIGAGRVTLLATSGYNNIESGSKVREDDDEEAGGGELVAPEVVGSSSSQVGESPTPNVVSLPKLYPRSLLQRHEADLDSEQANPNNKTGPEYSSRNIDKLNFDSKSNNNQSVPPQTTTIVTPPIGDDTNRPGDWPARLLRQDSRPSSARGELGPSDSGVAAGKQYGSSLAGGIEFEPGVKREELIELLAEFYAHREVLYKQAEQLQRQFSNIREKLGQSLGADANESGVGGNSSGSPVALELPAERIPGSLPGPGSAHRSPDTAVALQKDKGSRKAAQKPPPNYYLSLYSNRRNILIMLEADHEGLMNWLRQRQKGFPTLKNTTFELLKEYPNRSINICRDGPKILILPDGKDILYCYTRDQWLGKLWSDLRLSTFHYPIIVLNILIFLFGTTGNIFVCLSVYRNLQLRNVTNYFIVNLAFADFLVILICLPATAVWDLTLTWFFGTISCKLIMFLQDVSISVSVLTLTAISLDRYYAICHPLKFKSSLNQAKRIIVLIWIVSLIIMGPDLIYLSAKESQELSEAGLETVLYSDCNYNWSSGCSSIFQFVKTIFLYLVPLMLMFCAHYTIMKTLRVASTSFHNELQSMKQVAAAATTRTRGSRWARPQSLRGGAGSGSAKSPPTQTSERRYFVAGRQANDQALASIIRNRLVGGGDIAIENNDTNNKTIGADEMEAANGSIALELEKKSSSSPVSDHQWTQETLTQDGKQIRFCQPTGTGSSYDSGETVISVKATIRREGAELDPGRSSPVEKVSPNNSKNIRQQKVRGPNNSNKNKKLNKKLSDLMARYSVESTSQSVCSSLINQQSPHSLIETMMIIDNENHPMSLVDTTNGAPLGQQLLLTMHNKNRIESRRKAASMLAAIVVIFGICYLPVHLINFLRQFIEDIPQNDVTSTISMLSHCACYLNSAINPIIYNHMNSTFRAEFRKFLSCLCWRKAKRKRRPTLQVQTGSLHSNKVSLHLSTNISDNNHHNNSNNGKSDLVTCQITANDSAATGASKSGEETETVPISAQSSVESSGTRRGVLAASRSICATNRDSLEGEPATTVIDMETDLSIIN